MVRSSSCQMINIVCFHLLVWSEYGIKCLNITKYIDIVVYGLFIKKISNSMVQFSRPGFWKMSSATKNPTKPNFFSLHRIPHIFYEYKSLILDRFIIGLSNCATPPFGLIYIFWEDKFEYIKLRWIFFVVYEIILFFRKNEPADITFAALSPLGDEFITTNVDQDCKFFPIFWPHITQFDLNITL